MAEREHIWPELCRLILIHLVEKVSDEELNYNEAFSQFAPAVKSITERLGKIQVNDYCTAFTYHEKVVLLQTMIDGVHDLQSFKDLLAQRVEDKTEFNKEKIELY